MSKGLTVRRVLNNNVVQAVDDRNRQFVFTGRGIGHGLVPGDPVDERLIEQRFVSEGGHKALRQFADFVKDAPLDQLLIAGEAVALAQRELGITPSQALLLPIADHLGFALERCAAGQPFDHPLRWEVRELYPREAAVGDQILGIVKDRLGVRLPRDEAIAFAMHLVSAQLGQPDVARATKMTELIGRAFDHVREHFDLDIDRDALAASRFVTHLRYLFARLAQPDDAIQEVPAVLGGLADSYPEAAACAEDIRADIEAQVGNPLTPSELAYLTLHVARLTQSKDAGRPATNRPTAG